MAELYGSWCSSQAADTSAQTLGRMQAAAEILRPGQATRHTGPGFALGTLARHGLDPALLAWDDARQAGWAWIGEPPDPAVVGTPGELADDLTRGRFDRLWRSEPRFAACIVDARARTLWVASDRYGYQPLYYRWRSGVLRFASKVAMVLRSDPAGWSWDPAALVDLVAFEHLVGDRTLAEGVLLLPPATVLQVSGNSLSSHVYRPPQYDPDRRRKDLPAPGDDEAIEGLFHALDESVRRRVPADRRLAITLSGGMDSRALLHFARAHGADVVAYTYGLPGAPEIARAAAVAGKAGVRHEVVEVDGSHVPRWLDHGAQATDGMVSAVHYNILSMADAQLADPRRVLDGLSADAVLGGNLRPEMMLPMSSDRAVERVARWRLTGWATPDQRARLLRDDVLAATREHDPRQAIRHHFVGLTARESWRGCHRFDMLERQRRFTLYGPLMTQPLVDVQVPFWSNAFMEIAARLSRRQMFDRRIYLALYARHLRDLGSLPDARRGIPLTRPFAVRFAKRVLDAAGKRLGAPQPPGLTDYPGWLRGPLGPWLEQRLLDPHPALWDVIRRDAVERLLREHRTAQADHTKKLGILLALAAWRDRLAEG
jgi:asparagine synthase (glutamine-hydrolysing)